MTERSGESTVQYRWQRILLELESIVGAPLRDLKAVVCLSLSLSFLGSASHCSLVAGAHVMQKIQRTSLAAIFKSMDIAKMRVLDTHARFSAMRL